MRTLWNSAVAPAFIFQSTGWLAAIISFCLALFVLVPSLGAQTLAGINGTVTDPSGAVVPDAVVTAVNNDTGVSKQSRTSSTGTYIITDLIPGAYTVKVEKSGFKSTVNSSVRTEVGTKITVNAVMQPGTVSESVDVSAPAIALQTDQPQLGTTIETKQVQELPFELGGGLGGTGSRGRQIDQYIFLAPGVNGGAFSHRIDGGVDFQNEVVFNGIPAVQSETQGYQSNINPPFEMVNEFRVLTNTFSAQYGLAQGVAYYQFASGTNALHGDAFEILRNDYFDANNFPNQFAGVGTPVDKEHNFGFTLGGPVYIPKLYNGKDKTFFHVSIEWYRLNQSITTPLTVPTAAMKQGDFSAFPQNVFVPTNYTPPAGCPLTPGQQITAIPQSCFSPLASSLLSLIPDPKLSGFTSNLPSQLTSIPTRNFLGGFSIDHNLTQKQTLHFSYWRNTYSTYAEDNGAPFSNVLSDLKIEPRIGTGVFLTYSNSISNHLIMTAGFGWMGEINNESNVHGKYSFAGVQGGTILPTINFGKTGSNTDTNSSDTFAPTSWGVNGNGETFSDNRKLGLSFSNNWLYVRGRHTMNFGLDIRRSYQDDHECQACGGGFGFTSKTTSNGDQNTNDPLNINNTGSAFASFLLGEVDQSFRKFALETKLRNKYFAPYFQDDIKVTPKLTVNAGLRWDIAVPFTVAATSGQPANQVVFFNAAVANPGAISTITGQPLAGAASLLGTCSNCVGYNRADIDWHEFSPRLGFTYTVTPRTVVLGGYSLNHLDGGAFEYGTNKVAVDYGSTLSGIFNQATANNNVAQYGSWDARTMPNPPATPFSATVLNPTSGGGGLSVNSFSRNAGQLPYVQQWNIGIQREMPWNMFFTAAYIGNRGIHLPAGLNLPNSLNPGYLSLGNQLAVNWDDPTSQTVLQGLGFGKTTSCTPGLFAPYTNFACDNPPGSTDLAHALRPFPQYGFVTPNFDTSGTSLYNALQLQAQKRFTNGLSYLVTYTLSKNMTNTDSGFSTFNGGALNPYNQKAEWSLANNDQEHLINISAVYELPIGPGKKALNRNSTANRLLLGGWQISGVATYGSGTPFGISANGNPLLAAGNRANLVSGQPFSLNWGAYKAEAATGFSGGPPILNAAAFSSPGAWAIGNSTRNIGALRDPWLDNESIALAKHLRFTERVEGELRMEFYNVLNRFRACGPNDPNFSSALQNNVDAGAGAFGFANTACQGNNPRQGQATFIFRF